jgi:hypothetical protein
MQVFKTNKKKFWANELKGWTILIAFSILLYFVFLYFFPTTNDRIISGITVLFLLKIGDSLTQFHVKEIQICRQKNQLTLILTSRMSGEKIMTYNLLQASSELIINSGYKKYYSFPYILKIFLKPKDTFVIKAKYGFTKETLMLVDSELKLNQGSA